jgi:glyoxylase-like metal-dependent hydrolase (beta-lactamase superfamily II)
MSRLTAAAAAFALVAAGAFALPAPVHAQAPQPAAQQQPEVARMDMRKIAEDVYMMESSLGSSNAVFVVTPDGVFVWDADLKSADQVLAAIRKVTDKKVRYVAISHPAGDHSTGVWHYREDKPLFISTKRQMRDLFMQEAAEFAERKASNDPANAAYKNAEQIKPDIAFEGTMTLRFGGLTFQFTEEGTAHSTSDVTLFIPQKRVMMMGDLLDTDVHPGQGESAGIFFSNAKRWIEVMDHIAARQLPIDTYVPGHGTVHIGRGAADLDEMKRYWIALRNEVSKLISAGKSAQQVSAEVKMPPEFSHYRRPARMRQVAIAVYHQLIEQGYNP